MSESPLTRTLTSIGLGSSGCRRENASSRWVSAAARWAPFIAWRAARCRRGEFGRQIPLQGLEISDDHLQKVVEVVGDAARQLADGFHLLRLAQGLFVAAELLCTLRHLSLKRRIELWQRLLRSFALGDLALHGLGKVGVVDRDGSFCRQS